ncbi:ankyrin repeat domain-containing protein [Streptomyces sp. NPDC059104]|uniref:ankyrin repeat domain-containing protein n=1 Tax=Streptomyces sp. NPDC059104 TaxID=3346729 RepID=UPI0036CC312A
MSPDLRAPGALSPEAAASWLRVRRYAVPAWMIERATRHRLAGDWRAACAAASVEIGFDPAALASRHGAAVADAVTEDLRHLAPDLLRWHLPRVQGGRTTLAPSRRVLLASYAPDGGPRRGRGVPVLHVTTFGMVDGPQRLRLECAPLSPDHTAGSRIDWTTEDWTAARHFWDVRRTAELRSRYGPADRLPFFRPDGTPLVDGELPTADPGPADPAARAEWAAVLSARGEFAEAFAVSGTELDLGVPDRARSITSPERALASLAASGPDPARLLSEVRLLAAAGAGNRYRYVPDWRCRVLLELPGAGDLPVRDADAGAPLRLRLAEPDDLRGVPRLPEYAWRPLPDLQLLRTGRIAPRALHPLVAAALFPGSDPAEGPSGPAAPRPVRVRCTGVWHEVRSRGGVLDMPHTAQEQQRENALRAFGGTISGCFAVRESWTSGEGRLPRALRDERRDLFLRAVHGDAPGVLQLLDAGVDPHVRDAKGRTLLHMLPHLEHEELLPRLLAAGLGLETEDGPGRTALLAAVRDGGTAELVRALIEAGARLDVTDEAEMSLSQLVRRFRRDDLTFVRELVDERYPDIGADYFDEYMEWRDEEEAGQERQDAYEADPFEGDDPVAEEAKSAEEDPFGSADPFEGIEETGPAEEAEGTGEADGAEGSDGAGEGAGDR